MPDLLRDRLQASLGTACTLERELGGGGMSRVFVAREHALDRDVVVKVLAPELAAGVSADRFAREIRLAAALQQANIVPVHSAGAIQDAGGGAHEGLPYYTMPFVDGESLRHRLASGPIAIAEAVSVLRDVARALAYAHGHGIVHRDIKPDNVLLSGGAAVAPLHGRASAWRRLTADDRAQLARQGVVRPALGDSVQVIGVEPGVYRRLGELYEGRGDRRRAADYDARFVELWRTADPELQPQVAEVQARLARLRTREGGTR